jgi:hypothetical protein
MQRVVYERFTDSHAMDEVSKVNLLLKEGWEVFDFSINDNGMMVFVLELIEDEGFDDEDEEGDEDYPASDKYSSN